MEVRNLSFLYGRTPVLQDVSFNVPEGSVTTVLGSNGSGKSTLFALMTRNLPIQGGSVTLDGQNIADIRISEYARIVALVAQINSVDGEITVERLVEYGRTPYLSPFKRLDDEDRRLVEWAMKTTDVMKYRDCAVAKLSSGPRQRVWIAMALAQNTRLLFLDEPTTYLDIRYQVQILRMIRQLNEEHGITVVMVLHDMNQAITYSDQIVGLKDGRIIASGRPQEIFSSELVKQLFDINLEMFSHNAGKFVLQV
jgi:iron complex transport system ATP-binding protein